MAGKNYSIDGKKVYATITKLTATELKTIKKYLDLGYELVEVEAKKITKEEKAAKAAENPFSKQNVEAFLQQAGNEALYTEYQARYNEQAGTNRKQTINGKVVALPDEPKKLKDGTPKKKGYANCIGWFRDKFDYDEAAGKYVPKAKK